MFTCEDNAMDIINVAVFEYENHFDMEFPLYEYINLTQSEYYDFSVTGANKLSEFIKKRINTENPVEIPEDYHNRMY